MSELECTSDRCDGRPSGSLYLCKEHVREYQELVDRVPEVREELYTTMAKLDRVSARRVFSAAASKNPPLPLRERAMLKRHALWIFTGVVASEQARFETAGGELDLLVQMMQEAQAIIDLPKSKLVWGPCAELGEGGKSCPGVISTVENSDSEDVAVCPVCARLYTRPTYEEARQERVQVLLVDLHPEPMRSKEVCEYLNSMMGLRITRHNLKDWVDAGRLRSFPDFVSSSQSVRVARRYFPGEVLATHHAMRVG